MNDSFIGGQCRTSRGGLSNSVASGCSWPNTTGGGASGPSSRHPIVRCVRILCDIACGPARASGQVRRTDLMKTKLLALALLAGGSMFAQTRFSIGVGVGPSYPAPVYAYRAPRPGPDFVWVEGHWVRAGFRNRWIPGYWTRQPYRSGYYSAP